MKVFLASSALFGLILASVLYQHLPDGTIKKDGLLWSQLARLRVRPAELMEDWFSSFGYYDEAVWAQRRWYDFVRFGVNLWMGNNSGILATEIELGETTKGTLYYKPNRKPGGPGLMYFHDGSGVVDSSMPSVITEIVSKTEAAVIFVHYSLAPETTFPSQVLEVEESFKVLPIIAWRYNISMDRLGIMGEGFGGNLAAVLVTRSVVSGMGAEGDPRAKALMLMYPAVQFVDFNTTSHQDMQKHGLDDASAAARNWLRYLGLDEVFVPFMLNGSHIPTDVLKSKKLKHVDRKHIPAHLIKNKAVAAKRGEMEKYHLRNEMMRKAQRHFLSHLLNTDTAPLFADHMIDFPPTFLASCGYDPLRDDSHLYYRRLKQHKVKVTYKHYPDAMHGALSAFDLLQSGREMMDDLIAFVNEKL